MTMKSQRDLAAENERLKQEVAEQKKRAEAAVSDLCKNCTTCKHRGKSDLVSPCRNCQGNGFSNWDWRGVQAHDGAEGEGEDATD